MNHIQPARILVPTDFSEPSTAALRQAVLLAEHLGSHVDVVCADLLLPEVDLEDILGRDGGVDPVALKHRQERLESYIHVYVPRHVRGGAHLVLDSPVHAITEAVRKLHSDLIVMATHGRTGLPRFFLGSVCELVMRATDVPILSLPIRKMVPGTYHPHPIRKIICPTNYSSLSMLALEYAGLLARTFDAELTVVEVVEPQNHPHSVGELYRLKNWVPSELRDRCEYKQIELAFDAAGQIVSLAREAGSDLIVMGAEHKRRSDQSVVGATAERVVRHAESAVLTVLQPAVRISDGNFREASVSM